MTATLSLGRSVCLTSSWTSSSSVLCLAPSGIGGLHSLTAQLIQSNSGTSSAKFSYAPPVLTHISPSQGSSDGGTIILIDGLSLGADADELKISVGSTLCPSVRITTPDVQLSCTTAAGSGQDLMVAVSIGGQVRAQCHSRPPFRTYSSHNLVGCSELLLRVRSSMAHRFQRMTLIHIRARAVTF